MKNSQGFTLIELLISLTVFSILMIGVLAMQRDATQISRSVINQTAIQDDLRNAAAIISDEVQRAIYVFPPCGRYSSGATPTLVACGAAFATGYVPNVMNVNFSAFTFSATGSITARPNATGTSVADRTWEVRDLDANRAAPILAMIVAPRRPNNNECDRGGSSSEIATSKAQGCYQFVAYFPIRRSQVTGTATTYTAEQLEPDPENNNQWVLMEYRKNLDSNILATSVTAAGSPVSVPAVRWDEVGCNLEGYGCALGTNVRPVTDPDTDTQRRDIALPAIARGTIDSALLASFVSRMNSTVATVDGGSTQILMVGIQPQRGSGATANSGFQIDFSGLTTTDERGVLAVRLRLRAEIIRNTITYTVPASGPLEVFSAPRNIPQ